MTKETHDNEEVNDEQRQAIATKKMEDRIDDMNKETDRNAAARKQDEQDAQKNN